MVIVVLEVMVTITVMTLRMMGTMAIMLLMVCLFHFNSFLIRPHYAYQYFWAHIPISLLLQYIPHNSISFVNIPMIAKSSNKRQEYPGLILSISISIRSAAMHLLAFTDHQPPDKVSAWHSMWDKQHFYHFNCGAIKMA